MADNSPKPSEIKFDAEGSKRMQLIASGIFAPIYPVLAGQIVSRLSIVSGWCVDMGSGPGSLGLALAGITDLKMILLDFSRHMHLTARTNISASGLFGRCLQAGGDVHAIPLADNSIRLIVSRGSVFFWKELERAFREIHRVLMPSGRTYIRGGFGTAELRDGIAKKMEAVEPGWKRFRDRNLGRDTKDAIIDALNRTRFPYDLINDDSGFWIILKKEHAS
jgi:SAM-dependent methyltransferase